MNGWSGKSEFVAFLAESLKWFCLSANVVILIVIVADKEISIVTSRSLPKLTQNVITSSHGHFTPSLKISCISVQPFSRNVADKEISIAASCGLPELTQKAICVKVYRRTDQETDGRTTDAARLYDSQKNYSNCCHQMSDFKMHQRSDKTDKDCAA